MDNHMKGIKILDFSQALAGPYCTLMLGDSGAEIIKVERPGSGDMSRAWGAEFTPGMNSYFASINRNKKCMTIRMDSDEGRELIHKLAAWADVVVENYRPGVTQKLGMDYDTLSAINPRLVYCSITGFGSVGPDAKRPGFDLIAQGMGGIMGFTGEKGRTPTKVGVAIGDIIAGMFGAYGVMRALWERERSGEGQLVETSLLEGQMALLTFQAGRFFTTGESPKPAGNIHPLIAPYETFPTKDGYINIAAGNDGLWSKFCTELGIEDLEKDPRFDTNPKRVQNREELVPLLEKETVKFGKDELLDKMAKARIPVGPVNTLEELFGSEQVKALQTVQEVVHEKIGPMKVIASPINYSKTPDEIRTPPSLLGEHTDEILAGVLNLSETDIAALKEKSII
ncbi:MAG: CoA transferase [Desulfobacterales bacterium]|nr:CoA transferase [Desulfobacterales bacterium]